MINRVLHIYSWWSCLTPTFGVVDGARASTFQQAFVSGTGFEDALCPENHELLPHDALVDTLINRLCWCDFRPGSIGKQMTTANERRSLAGLATALSARCCVARHRGGRRACHRFRGDGRASAPYI